MITNCKLLAFHPLPLPRRLVDNSTYPPTEGNVYGSLACRGVVIGIVIPLGMMFTPLYCFAIVASFPTPQVTTWCVLSGAEWKSSSFQFHSSFREPRTLRYSSSVWHGSVWNVLQFVVNPLFMFRLWLWLYDCWACWAHVYVPREECCRSAPREPSGMCIAHTQFM